MFAELTFRCRLAQPPVTSAGGSIEPTAMYRGCQTSLEILLSGLQKNMSADMQGKVVVITGATSGIGQVAAESLAGMGARIVQVARDRKRGQEAVERLRKAGPNANHTIHYADLLQLSEMKRVAAEIATAEPRIDVLMNNAGAQFGGPRHVTEDGLERTFALNHMSYFVLTLELLPRLFAAALSRIVNTSSDAHQAATMDLNDLQSEKEYPGTLKTKLVYGGPPFKVYGLSKLCNILFTRELARRLEGTGITANCLHPGFVATRFADASGGLVSAMIRGAKTFALTPEEGAKTIVYLATAPEVAKVSGKYFHLCKEVLPSDEAQKDADARRLWD